MTSKSEIARATIDRLFEEHASAALAYSGGADSSILLHLCEPYRDRITVLWVNTGHMLPHMVEHVRKTASGGPFVELSADLDGWWRERGLPSSVVPVSHMAAAVAGGTYAPREPKIQSWMSCCFEVRTVPMFNWLAQHPEVTLLLHGQRDADRLFLGDTDLFHPRVFRGPLADWTNADADAYIEEHGIELPRHYADGVRDSFECWCCPAMADDGAPKRLDYLRRHHPELWGQARATIDRVNEVVKTAAGTFERLAGP